MEVAPLGHLWTPAQNWSGPRWSFAGPWSCHAVPPMWTRCMRTSGCLEAAFPQTRHCCRETESRGQNCKGRRKVTEVTEGPRTPNPEHMSMWLRVQAPERSSFWQQQLGVCCPMRHCSGAEHGCSSDSRDCTPPNTGAAGCRLQRRAKT